MNSENAKRICQECLNNKCIKDIFHKTLIKWSAFGDEVWYEYKYNDDEKEMNQYGTCNAYKKGECMFQLELLVIGDEES